ncbi:hypothetical protein ANANG_G00315190, partial [Anguilla anguilla]
MLTRSGKCRDGRRTFLPVSRLNRKEVAMSIENPQRPAACGAWMNSPSASSHIASRVQAAPSETTRGSVRRRSVWRGVGPSAVPVRTRRTTVGERRNVRNSAFPLRNALYKFQPRRFCSCG